MRYILAVVVVHAYHPNAQTLYDAHLRAKPPTYQPIGRSTRMAQNQTQTVIPERTMWSYIVQIATAIKKVHEVGQAVRMVDVSKILVTGQNRLVSLLLGVVHSKSGHCILQITDQHLWRH